MDAPPRCPRPARYPGSPSGSASRAGTQTPPRTPSRQPLYPAGLPHLTSGPRRPQRLKSPQSPIGETGPVSPCARRIPAPRSGGHALQTRSRCHEVGVPIRPRGSQLHGCGSCARGRCQGGRPASDPRAHGCAVRLVLAASARGGRSSASGLPRHLFTSAASRARCPCSSLAKRTQPPIASSSCRSRGAPPPRGQASGGADGSATTARHRVRVTARSQPHGSLPHSCHGLSRGQGRWQGGCGHYE
nr:E3 ubiquitin-protein ligase MARCHF11-like [Caretta caretta]